MRPIGSVVGLIETLLAIPEAGRREPEAVRPARDDIRVPRHDGRPIEAGLKRPSSNTAGRSRPRSRIRRYCRLRASSARRSGARWKAVPRPMPASADLDAARADWSRLAAIKEPDQPDVGSLGPMLIRAWSGDAAGFLVDAEGAVAIGAVKKNELVTLARAACVAIANVRSNSALTDRLGADAVDWILAARDDGVFASQGAWKDLIDPRFDPIARRPGFRDLKSDLTFPTQPFASETTTQ